MRGKKIVQLLKAIEALASANGATIKELQRALNRKDKKAVYRIIETLEALGFPIYDDKEEGERSKRWRFEESYLQRLPNVTLPDFSLTLHDIVALQLLRGSSHAFRGTEVDTTIDQVFSRLDAFVPAGFAASLQKIAPLFSSADKMAKDYSGKEELIEQLVDAMLNRTTCIVEYYSFSREENVGFKIDPLLMFEYSGGLYLYVRATSFGDLRILALERIQVLIPTEATFEDPEDFDPEEKLKEPFELTCGDPVKARIRISANQAKYVRERPYHSQCIVAEEPDGAVILELDTSGRRDVIRWVLSYGVDAEVLEPLDLREEVVGSLNETLRVYS